MRSSYDCEYSSVSTCLALRFVTENRDLACNFYLSTDFNSHAGVGAGQRAQLVKEHWYATHPTVRRCTHNQTTGLGERRTLRLLVHV
jgi:hypothetical protein